MKPDTFKDALRLAYSRYLVAAGIAVGIGAAVLVAILAFGGWPEEHYGQIITILGRVLIGAGLVMALVIAMLGLGGPARNIKARFGSASIETEGDE